MIVTKLQGGIANQIFQWACGKNFSIKYGVPLFLDISFYSNQFGCTPRKFSLEKFPNIDFKIFYSENVNPNRREFKILNENSFFSEFIYEKEFDYYLNGYWGSEKYFIENELEIRKNLSYDSKFIEKIKGSKYEKVFSDNSVSIHVRRTDYLSSNGYHPVQPISYYEKALEIIGDFDFVYIFSDDIEWCKENLNFQKSIFVEGMEDIEDLWLMSLCKNNIIANSTFSWWGSWMNSRKGKTIAPLNWFGENTGLSSENIYLNNWIKI